MARVREIGVNAVTVDTTVTTTTETVAVSSGPIVVPKATVEIVVQAWAILTTGVATTTVTPRIRRGTAITGTAVGDAIAQAVKAAAGSSEPFTAIVREERANVATVEYSLTLEQAAATGNGTIAAAGIVVFVL